MKRSIPLLLALIALLYAPAFAAESKAAKDDVKKEDAKATSEATPKATPAPTAAATAEPKKEEAKPSEEAKKNKDEKPAAAEVSHKSGGLATTLAIIPGVAIHGMGHMYAGSWMSGLGLFALGTGGAILAYDQGNNGWSDIQKLTDKSSDGTIPTDLSGAYSRVGLIIVGTTAFLWSWFEDMAGASTAVDTYNKKADEAAKDQARLELLPANGGAELAYIRKF